MTLEEWRHDLELAGRGLLRAKGFTAAAALTLAVGIAGTTVMFALVEGVLLRPLPVPAQGSLIVARNELRTGGSPHWPFRARDLDAIAKATGVLEGVAGVSHYDPSPYLASENGPPRNVTGAAVTGDFFRVVGGNPVLGRALAPSDDVIGAENVLVITHRLWQRRYGGAPDVIGRRLTVSERPFTIVGVMPPDFECPLGVEAWMTLAASASTVANPAFREGVLRDVDLVARLRPGATVEQAESELERLTPGLEAEAPPGAPRGLRPVVRRYEDAVVGDVRPALLRLFGAVGLVLLIASANAANLLILRGESRRSELALRVALGAGRGRLVRQMLAESLLVALAGGAVGLAATGLALGALVALVPGGLTRAESVRVDAGVAAFTVAVSFVTAALAGLVPALSLARTDVAAHLRSGGRGTLGSAARRGRQALVVAQVALAVTVVAAAGLLTRSLLRLQSVDMGLAADRLVLVSLALPKPKYADAARHVRFLEEVVARLEAAPGIEGATPVHSPPFAGTHGWDAPEFAAEGQDPERAAANLSLNLESIHPGYFETLGVTLVRGRGFTEEDRRGAPEVAVVSDDVAARTWPGVDPIGKRLKFGRPDSKEPWRTVVSVARPTRYRELRSAPPTLYVPAQQFIDAAETLVLRTSSPLERVADVVRERVRAVDSDVPVLRVAPFKELLGAPLSAPRFDALLIALFGTAALLLAAIGLYAVIAASVRRREREIGLRMALGATAADVRGLVLREGLRLGALGSAVGLALAMAAGGLLRGLLFGVHPLDPATLVGTALLVLAASGLACHLPARTASRSDPVALLRAE
ncbi:MAG TPA: ABC transporter permease [Vicinamibacteria bacterium]|nr:ABC transporter permease [Vicinamibacteria bacterium]